MRPNRMLLVAAVVMAGAVAAMAAAPAAWARGSRPSPAPAPPPPGWVLDRVRFEPVDPGGEIDVAGIGAYRGAIEIGRQPAAAPTTTTTAKPGSTRRATTATTTKTVTTTKAVATGPVMVVNELGLDDYVSGIAEVPSGWPAEALKAQAIAARTYALHELALGHPLCATDACQVYAGLAKERGPNGEAWVAAVKATSGQVLLYKNQPILAMYSSSDGGHTVAGSAPYLKAVDDPDDHVSPLSRWQVTIPFDVLTSVFATPMPVLDVHRTAHDTVDLIWNNDDGTTGDLDVPTGQFSSKLNSTQPAPEGLPRIMPSLRFEIVVDQQAGTITVDGQGFGHGIGMSQFGALGKAERGMSAADILAFYYGGIRPVVSKDLPPTVRVVLNSGVSAPASVGGSGRFRVRGPDGNLLGVMASGVWQVNPTANGVRVVAPADQAGPPAIAISAVDTAPGVPPTVRFRLGAPAMVAVTADAPGQPSVKVPLTAMEAGDHAVRLPAVLPDGDWTVTVAADAGGGRTAATPVALHVGAVPVVAQVAAASAAAGPVVALASPASSSRRAVVSRAQGTPLAVGMTGLAVLTLLAAIGGLWRGVPPDVTTDAAGLV